MQNTVKIARTLRAGKSNKTNGMSNTDIEQEQKMECI